jgi:hypothetical protein
MPMFHKQAPPPPKGKNSGKVGKFKSQVKKPSFARRRPIESLIYGEELFQSNIKKEKEIVIGFYPFTANNLRISKDGKFVIERVSQVDNQDDPFWWNLYYCEPPISNFTPDKIEIQSPDDPNLKILVDPTYILDESSCIKFPDFRSVKDLADKVISLVRAEFLADRQRTLEEVREQDRKEQEEKDRLEKEQEENEDLLDQSAGNKESFFIAEDDNESEESQLSEEIFGEEEQEEENTGISQKEAGESAA